MKPKYMTKIYKNLYLLLSVGLARWNGSGSNYRNDRNRNKQTYVSGVC